MDPFTWQGFIRNDYVYPFAPHMNLHSVFRSPLTYFVRPGDTLYNIARMYNTTVEALKRTNNLTGDIIYPGQALIIPGFTLPDGVYSIGSRGNAVRRIQQALYAMGYRILVDGIYGSQTADIILNIQKKYPEITADGVYGPQTKQYLERLLASNYRIVQNPENLLVLVNKKNALPHYYTPPDLVTVNVPFPFAGFLPQKQMRQVAARALEQLFSKAARDKISLYGSSGYRSYERQAQIFKSNYQKSPSYANRYSARPGESEHQTGLAIDLTSPAVNFKLVQDFGNTPEGRWLARNAPDFGFIIRYPRGKESITGYEYEPWHIRYVGIPTARRISDRGLTLEEYLGR